ncbi:Phosphatidylserine decarboxylase proenzyme [bacterium HR19]|nr:Phosphatidylserine decarboxylase proenzyme [bacterium HR19]
MKIRKEFLLPGSITISITMISLLLTKNILVAIPFLVLLIFLLNFFRDPERIPEEQSENSLISPADGNVFIKDEIEIDKTEIKELFPQISEKKMKRIAIFMSPFDVHVNRAPCDAEILGIEKKEGGFERAFLEKSEKNSRVLWWLKTNEGKDILLIQIAGAIARRISTFKKKGDFVKKGERIGMIYLGSRVDMLIPEDWNFSVSVGDKVLAGKTKVGEKNSDKKENT